MTTLALTALALLQSGCERYALDRQMEELCRKDGGVKVYESVRLPADRFDLTGRVISSPAQEMGRGVFVQVVQGGYGIESRDEVIKAGDPFKGFVSEGRLLRFTTTVRRLSDGKVLGEEISYGRTGGDISLGHPSQSICPNPRPARGVVQAVLEKGE